MRAIRRINYGGPEVITIDEVEKPNPKSNELLIKVHATTVNRTDQGVLTGMPFVFRFFIGLFSPKLKTLGTDFSGEVVGVGDSVSKFAIGDGVWGFNDEGIQSQAEYVTIKEDEAIVHKPEGISFTDIAACAEGAHYAFNFITKTKVKKGDKVLVYGATGAIGTAAVQILKYFGCYVTAVGNTKNIEMIKTLGADKVYNWEKEDFTQDEELYDVVCDAVGKSSFGACKKLLKEGGLFVSSELGPRAENLYLPMLTMLSKRKVKFPIPINIRRSLLLLNRMIKEGKYHPVIDRTYNIDQVAEAYRYVMSGQKTGNVILRISA